MSQRKRKVLVSLAALVVAAVMILVVWPREREPEYQGKKLSEWIQTGYESSRGTTNEAVARFAVQQIGTNALPYLLKAMAYERSPKAKALVLNWAQVGSRFSHPATMFVLRRVVAKDHRAVESEFGFRVLGSVAIPAIPRLKELARDSKREVCWRAQEALGYMGSMELGHWWSCFKTRLILIGPLPRRRYFAFVRVRTTGGTLVLRCQC